MWQDTFPQLSSLLFSPIHYWKVICHTYFRPMDTPAPTTENIQIFDFRNLLYCISLSTLWGAIIHGNKSVTSFAASQDLWCLLWIITWKSSIPSPSCLVFVLFNAAMRDSKGEKERRIFWHICHTLERRQLQLQENKVTSRNLSTVV